LNAISDHHALDDKLVRVIVNEGLDGIGCTIDGGLHLDFVLVTAPAARID
jgi:hypothetical protein